MAELLVKLEPNWMESIPEKTRDNWPAVQQEKFNYRTIPGDIITVKPDGWNWGKKEGPPKFVIIKLPGIAVSEVKNWEKSLIVDSTPSKKRKYNVSNGILTAASIAPKGILITNKTALEAVMIIKTE